MIDRRGRVPVVGIVLALVLLAAAVVAAAAGVAGAAVFALYLLVGWSWTLALSLSVRGPLVDNPAPNQSPLSDEPL